MTNFTNGKLLVVLLKRKNADIDNTDAFPTLHVTQTGTLYFVLRMLGQLILGMVLLLDYPPNGNESPNGSTLPLWMVLITSNYLHAGGWTSHFFNYSSIDIDFSLYSFYSSSLNVCSVRNNAGPAWVVLNNPGTTILLRVVVRLDFVASLYKDSIPTTSSGPVVVVNWKIKIKIK
jgi:hypothetical protein